MENKYNRRAFFKKSAQATAGAIYLLSPIESIASIKHFSNDSEKTILAKMIYGEARGLLKEQDQKEAIMIMYTAINRAEDRINGNGKTTKGAILAKSQYSCFNPKNPNLEKLKNPEKDDPNSWKKALTLSEKVLEGNYIHLNYGQSHYYLKNTETPFWAKSSRMKKVCTPDSFKHNFYRDTKA